MRGFAQYVVNGEFIVKSYVDAENSSGAMIRTNFVMRVKSIADGKWRLLEVTTVP